MVLNLTTRLGFHHILPVIDSKVGDRINAYVTKAIYENTYKEKFGKIPQEVQKRIQEAFQALLKHIEESPSKVKESIINTYNSFYSDI